VANQENRTGMLETALRIFARDGFHNADVQVIADEAGVGKGTVYRHFGNKQELFLANSAHCMQMVDAFVRNRVGDEEKAAKLIAEVGPIAVLKKIAMAGAEFYQ